MLASSCSDDSDVLTTAEDDMSYIDKLAQQLKDNPSATYIPQLTNATPCSIFINRLCGDDLSNDHADKVNILEDSSTDGSAFLDQLADSLKENPTTFMNNGLQLASVGNPSASTRTAPVAAVVGRRRSSMSAPCRDETDDETLSMSLSPQSNCTLSVANSPLAKITPEADMCVSHRQPLSSTDEDEIFGSPMSTNDTFVSISRSETPRTAATTPATTPSPVLNDKLKSSFNSDMLGLKREPEEHFSVLNIIGDEEPTQLLFSTDTERGNALSSNLEINEGVVIVVHKATDYCPLCGIELPIDCLRVEVRTGDVSIGCRKCNATIIMEALYHPNR